MAVEIFTVKRAGSILDGAGTLVCSFIVGH